MVALESRAGGLEEEGGVAVGEEFDVWMVVSWWGLQRQVGEVGYTVHDVCEL